jgi:glycosyltransferase involved in cell wall biosynthesis
LDSSPNDLASYYSLKAYCFRHLNIQSFDVVIGIFSPHHHLRLCYRLNHKYKVPYVLDFRDLWDNRIIHHQYKPTAVENIQDRLAQFYWKKWLAKALFFTITSEPWREKINEFSATKGFVITNGFDDEMKVSDEQMENKWFTILHTGSLYEHQKLEIFLEGCKRFVEHVHPDAFKVKFIGAERGKALSGKLSGFMYKPSERIRNYLSSQYCEITTRIPKAELVREFEKAQLLLFPSFPSSPGTYAGKIFDYLAMKKPVLVVPDDHSVVGELIRKTQAGVVANTPEVVFEMLMKYYNQWTESGKVDYTGVIQEINQYSRKNQVAKMASYLKHSLS